MDHQAGVSSNVSAPSICTTTIAEWELVLRIRIPPATTPNDRVIMRIGQQSSPLGTGGRWVKLTTTINGLVIGNRSYCDTKPADRERGREFVYEPASLVSLPDCNIIVLCDLQKQSSP